MNNYIQKIIDYFFHHEVSDGLTNRVYERMVLPADDEEREEALSRIWSDLDGAACSEKEVDAAFRKLEYTLNKNSGMKPKKVEKKIGWGRIAAVWTIPFIMLCFSAYFYYNADSEQKPLSEITYIQHYAEIGTRKRVILPDSSFVWLNAGSLLVYPSTFLSETRNVYLSGEGYFDVTKDKQHPFVVSTNHLKLEVLGTTFNLSAYPENDQIRATLETGLLQVSIEQQPGEYVLNPNDQLIYTPSTGKVEQFKVRAADYSDWRMGGLFFSNMPLDDVLKALERAYNVKFHLQTSIYQNQVLRVHFNKDESLENVLRIIKILIPGIEYRIDGNNVYLR